MYADRAAFDLAFGATEASELEGSASDRINQSLAMATATADSYVSTRYATPVESVGDVLRRAVLDIARHALWDNRAPDEVRTRYEDALRWLRDVSAGKATLTTATGAQATLVNQSGGIAASVRDIAYGGTFDARYDATRINTGVQSWR